MLRKTLQSMKICISFYVMVVIVADKLMMSQFWLNNKASLSCLCCDKDPRKHVLASAYVGVFSLILQTFIMIG